jgi:hypothetical protein
MRIPEVCFGALLAVAIFSIGFVVGTLPFGQSTQHPGAVRWWQDPLANLILGLVLVGIFQAVLFYIQLRNIRKSLGPTEAAASAARSAAEHIHKVERAYVFGAPGHCEPTQSGRKFYLTLDNYGKTPGIVTKVYYKLLVTLPIGGPDYSDPTPENMILEPSNGSAGKPRARYSLNVTTPCEQFLAGRIWYLDLYSNEEHYTSFLHHVSANGSRPASPRQFPKYWERT